MSSMANKTQVGGGHYKVGGEEHWDRVDRLGLDYFQGQITKYVERWKLKSGVEDLRKARHFLDKYIELNELPQEVATFNPPDEDAKLFGPKSGSGHKPWTEPPPFKRTGYIGYTYEGGTVEWDLFKCHICRQEVKTAVNGNPAAIHTCTPLED